MSTTAQYPRAVPLHRFVRRFVRWSWFGCFLGEYEWYRRLYGGKWMQTHVDGPVNGCIWLNVPEWATPSYREPLWRGTPLFVDYDVPYFKL